MAAIGNLNDFVKYQMGKGFESGGGTGAAGTAAELAVGFGLAQQMMKDGFAGHAAPTVAVPPIPGALPAAGGPLGNTALGNAAAELLSPAEAAQALGVSEADVMTVLESGELKGKKIGTTWRITRAALTAYMSA
jgi:excisionase family DNA binding protein